MAVFGVLSLCVCMCACAQHGLRGVRLNVKDSDSDNSDSHSSSSSGDEEGQGAGEGPPSLPRAVLVSTRTGTGTRCALLRPTLRCVALHESAAYPGYAGGEGGAPLSIMEQLQANLAARPLPAPHQVYIVVYKQYR